MRPTGSHSLVVNRIPLLLTSTVCPTPLEEPVRD